MIWHGGQNPLQFSGVLLAFVLTACGGGGGGGATPGLPPASHGPIANVVDNWIMYGHDSRHTSASRANVNGRFQVMWRYDPQAASGDTFSALYNAVAMTTGVYVHWFQSGASILSAGPSVDGISVNGARTWTFVAKKDYDLGHWLSVFNSDVVFQDDEEGFLSSATGKLVSQGAKSWPYTFDMWGETIPDPSGLYGAIETSNLVARAQSDLHTVWSVSAVPASPSAPVLANGLVIIGTGNGIEAHDSATGRLVWTSPVQPAGYGMLTGMCAALASNTLVVTANDGLHVLSLANGGALWHGTVAGAQGTVMNPVIVNDPARGATVYVTDNRGVIALAAH
ncbi:MAG: PQQ-like beta-propeller repeat protein [Candidatus Eremiobacteraeota bacterium]|nr:PQQ-like beta-propeller repeat protein [Candidatus Eremiobacteraeota bacterium]